MSFESALTLLVALGGVASFLWNIQDRAAKRGEEKAQLQNLILEMQEMRSELTAAKDEIKSLRLKNQQLEEEIKGLRKDFRESR